MWVALVVAAVGFAGVLLTQIRADRRADARVEREREWEGARWEREDALRTFEHRREAYLDFYESVRELAFTAYNFGMGLTEFATLDPNGSYRPTGSCST